MKKFFITLLIFLLIILCEVGKYFINYKFFYFALVFELFSLFICIWSFLDTKKILKFFSTLIAIFSFVFLLQNLIVLTENKNKTNNFEYVIHAGGGLDGKAYLNSKEGFTYYVQNDYKYIELDFLYTSDNEIVCSHYFEGLKNFDKNNKPSLLQFENSLIYDKYNGITAIWLIEQLKIYDDITIIFDTKEKDSILILEELSNMLAKNDIDFNSFIIQIYSEQNYNEIKANTNIKFARFWYTNYKSNYKSIDVLKIFEDKADVEAYVLYINDWWTFTELDFNTTKSIAVHTIHDKDFCNFITKRNVDFVYIDWPIN